MVTRRQFLSALPVAAAWKPCGAAEDPERIDSHLHIHRPAPALFAALEKVNWRCLSICVSHEIADEPSPLEELIAKTSELSRATKGRVAWASTFDARGFEGKEFSERVNSGLERTFQDGAIAVKIWKNVGMGIKAKSGEWVLPDHKAFTPVLETIQKAGRTLIAHLAEPDGAWMPLGPSNSENGYYSGHPEWHMLNRPGAQPKDAILAARDHVLARHPKLRVVGCHLGSDEEHLDRLAKRLDTYPNFAVDAAARVRYFMSGDREQVRQFLLKYQDRVLYATDFTLDQGDDERAAAGLDRTHNQDWSFFATGNVIESRRGSLKGLDLPEPVVRKIFHENALHWIPGLARV
jgi:hypothetical protein